MTKNTLLPNVARLFEKMPRFFRRHRLMKAYMWLTGEDPVQLVRIRHESRAYVDLSDGFQRLIVIDDHYEDNFFRIADTFLVNGGQFFDVGANFGLFSIGLLSTDNPAIHCHLFEPNQNLITIIKRSLKYCSDERCCVLPYAVSSTDGVARFLEVPEQTGISHLVTDGGKIVKTIALDSYIATLAHQQIALMKVDVEGHELNVLRGASLALQERRVGAIYFEYCVKHLMRPDSPGDPLPFLAEMGYEVCFCQSWDLRRHGPPTHTIAQGYPGHGLPLIPIAGWPQPVETDLLAVPSECLSVFSGQTWL